MQGAMSVDHELYLSLSVTEVDEILTSHLTSRFGDESFQTFDCNQTLNKNQIIHTKHYKLVL